MNHRLRFLRSLAPHALAWGLWMLAPLPAQQPPPASEPSGWTTEQDHQHMMQQLGIRALRPGPNGRAQPGEPNAANYDPAKANPYPDLPELLTLNNGQKVSTAEAWWKQRRPEIVEDFEREIYGRVPPNAPQLVWTVKETAPMDFGGIAAVGQIVIGRPETSPAPQIPFEMQMTVVVPAKAKGKVPVLMMFVLRDPGLSTEFLGFGGRPLPRPTSQEMLLAAGWGYALLTPNQIQPDNGAGLTKGIIGLTNQGKPRKPDDWGALRAWAWGASRGLDYLETYAPVDARRVGIEGVSRYGKAALVAMAMDPRFAVALIGSSGEGGAKLHRRNFGEAVENLTGSGAYHWMAGNFLKYGAAESTFGAKNAGDLPVDAHQLIALCAPRPVFISYGIPEKGDALWLDQQGSFMAAVAAGPAYRLLGARDLGVSEDYRTAQMPPVNTGLLDGELAWRQHDGGHEDRTNMPYFLPWASRLLQHEMPSPDSAKH